MFIAAKILHNHRATGNLGVGRVFFASYLGCFFSLLFFAVAANAVTQSRVVTVTGGQIEGKYNGGIAEFKGIPYAAPPVGNLRFKGPADVVPWSGIKSTKNYGSECYAGSAALQLLAFEEPDEDCLFLNVFTPKYRSWGEKQPVMVFIPGGGLLGGSGGGPLIYQPKYLVNDGDLIVVTVNYRLAGLGFAWHEALNNTEEGSVKGNYGLRDQIKALEWVRDNIAAFGGDPNNVTIFGESGGGWSMCNLIASPLAASLFDKVIMQSGGCIAEQPERAQVSTVELAEKLGCYYQGNDQAFRQCLQSKSPLEIRNAQEALCDVVGGICQPSAIIDGNYLKDHPLKVVEAGNHNRATVMAGSTDDELPSLFFTAFTYQKYKEAIEAVFTKPADAELVSSWYNVANFGTYNNALGRLFTDAAFRCQARSLASALYNNQQEDVYLYEFHLPIFLVPTPHGSDLFYIFQNPTPLLPLSYNLHLNMTERWTEFAKDGNPNVWLKPYWATFSTSDYGRMYGRMRLDNLFYMEYPVNDTGCDILESMEFSRYLIDPELLNPTVHSVLDWGQKFLDFAGFEYPEEWIVF